MQFYTNVERHGDRILYRGYDGGEKVIRKYKYGPTLYVRADHGTESSMRNLDGDPVVPRQFDTMSEAKKFLDKYKDVHGMQVCGNTDYVSQFIYDMFPGKIEFDPSLIDVGQLDIEVDVTSGYGNVETADKAVSCITLKRSREDVYHVFSTLTYDPNKTELEDVDPANIRYHFCLTEATLLQKFVNEWSRDYVDIVSGWNVKFFDIGYLVKRIENVLNESYVNKMSPFGHVRREVTNIMGRDNFTYYMTGITVLDYMDVFGKFDFKYGTLESMKLDHVAYVVLGDRKLDYSEYGDLNGLMLRNPQKYVDYNIKDVQIVQRLEEKLKLIELVYTMAYSSGVNFVDTLGTTAIWDCIIFRDMMQQGIVCPLPPSAPAKEEYAGGYVKETQPGMWEWLVTFDLASLYPHIIMQLNISPETYVREHTEMVNVDMILNHQYKNKTEYAVAPNGACFRRDKKGIIPTIIDTKYNHRAAVKKRMLTVEQEIEDLRNKIRELEGDK